jgi:hypothetical protein
MKIETTYNLGDKITIGGCEYKILGMHLYLSERCRTERYYIGNQTWVTVKKGCNNEKD